MDDFTFSAVTSVFTIGGLLGSMAANFVTEKYGRKGATQASAVLTILGTALMTIGSSVGSLGFGRMLVGVGSGIGLCVGPIYLSEIAPPAISGNVGVLTQLSIVLGIMVTQLLGLNLATPTTWRAVLFASCALAISQLVTSSLACETPAYLGGKGLLEQKRHVSRKLWGEATRDPEAGPSTHRNEQASDTLFDEDEADNTAKDPLLSVHAVEDDDVAEARRHEPREATVTVTQLASKPELRQPLMIVCLAMLSQQVSGVNAVLYYSNDILSKALPDSGPYISLGITIVNVLMTFPPIILIEKMGRRRLLTISTIGAIVSLLIVGFGLNSNLVTISSIAIITFIMSFASGLGPVPFVMIPEVSPFYAVSALSSVGLSLNWVANFLVGLVFLPLRNFLSGSSHDKDGRVFYVFALALALSMGALSRLYKG
ncbi:hypothetical protein ONZ45_g9191 [Pleurotus djamor]|nr:hypothetical protein ONZ45_g9191 [Pleurotus djamor]